MSQPPWFRRKYLVNSDFQMSFVTRMALIISAICFILYASNQILFYRFNLLGKKMNLSADHEFYRFIQEQSQYMSATFLAVFICATIVICAYSFFLSHRIAGPLENLKRRFKEFEAASKTGELHELKVAEFRKNDFFQELAVAYNEHLENLKQHHPKSSKTNDAEEDNVVHLDKAA